MFWFSTSIMVRKASGPTARDSIAQPNGLGCSKSAKSSGPTVRDSFAQPNGLGCRQNSGLCLLRRVDQDLGCRDDKSPKDAMRSESGPTVTTIQRVSGNGPTVTIISGQGTETVLDGFTITGGNRGGIFIRNTSPVIENCIFTNNSNNPFSGDGSGGGIRIEGTLGFDVLISNCRNLQQHGKTGRRYPRGRR